MNQQNTQFPDWYWRRGLHDAVILAVTERSLTPNYKEKSPQFNCLELEIDCKQAIFEQDVKTIRFYNYKIKSPQADLAGGWWIRDTLRQLPNKKYLLEVELAGTRKKRVDFVVEFQTADIQRE